MRAQSQRHEKTPLLSSIAEKRGGRRWKTHKRDEETMRWGCPPNHHRRCRVFFFAGRRDDFDDALRLKRPTTRRRNKRNNNNSTTTTTTTNNNNAFDSGDVAPPTRKSVIYGVDDAPTPGMMPSSPAPRMGEVEEKRDRRATAAPRRTAAVPNALERTTKEQEEKSRKSANVIDLFERAASPIGTVERAKAALSAAQAQSAVTSPIEIGRAKKVSDEGLPTTKGCAKNDSKEVSDISAANAMSGVSGMGAGTLRNAQKKAHSINHSIDIDDDTNNDATGLDFWSWTPPERNTTDKDGAPVAKLQKKTQNRIEQAVQVAERGVPQTLNLDFQSQMQAKGTKELALAFESQMATQEKEEKVDQRAPTEAEFATAVRELGADGEVHGELSDGTRWWREAGTSELENGRICEWTLVRGQSADGSVEWEEKWWSSADAFDYKELGAIKSGRDGHGNVWQESWSEISCSDVSRGFFTDASKKIERSANKWGADANGAEWHEDWREAYWGDGVVDRECFKKSCIGKNKIPEDGHASRWNHNWKEKWDGKGGCMKTNDSWADRDIGEDGGSGRSWGERWSERWGSYASHGRQGEREGSTWNDRDGHKFTKDWGEEHWPDGRVRKYGHSSDGSDHWDVWEDSDGWWERHPSFGWAEAVTHSPQLMSIKPRKAKGIEKKKKKKK